jgi:hypothetical protein
MKNDRPKSAATTSVTARGNIVPLGRVTPSRESLTEFDETIDLLEAARLVCAL